MVTEGRVLEHFRGVAFQRAWPRPRSVLGLGLWKAWPLGAWLCVALPFRGAPSSGQCPVSVWAGEGAESREQGVLGG